MKKSQKLVASAISGLFAGAISTAVFASGAKTKSAEADKAAKTETVEESGQCHGVNACKGQSACAGATHDCAGMNECSKKGWVNMTEKECKSKNGTFKREE